MALYNAVARPTPVRTEIVVSPQSTATSGRATVEASAAGVRASAVPEIDPAFTSALLRPGVEELSRFDVALDGSSKRQVAVSSRFTATSDCEQTFVELFALREHQWTRVFDAADESVVGGALLPQTQRTGPSCYPQLRVFAAMPAGDRDLIAIGAAYADGSVHLLVLGWDVAADAPAPHYDRRSGAGGRVARLGDGRIELSEDLPGPAGTSGPIGRLSELVSADADGVHVARRIAPNCDRGRLSPGGAATGGPDSAMRALLLDCSNGTHAAAAIPDALVLSPAGIAWENLRDGDSVQVEYDATSLQPGSADAALPIAVSLTDYAANTRRLNAERQPRQTATSVHSAAQVAPSQRTGPTGSVPISQAAPAYPQTSSAGSGDAAPLPDATRAPRSSGPPGVPKTAVTPPPPPRSPPFAVPPQAPPAPGQ